MPNWNELLNQSTAEGSTQDIIRRRFLKKLERITKRNVIIYYSGWLQKNLPQNLQHLTSINDLDKNGFMSVVHKLDRSKGLDLILHTPGGDMAATESLIVYLRAMFGTDIRAFIPQIAMSGGAMIACSCKEIYMGEHSNIGPYDPQINGLPAQAVKEEVERAANEMSTDQTKAYLWQPILQKLNPGFLTICENAIKLADDVMVDMLTTGMFNGEPNAKKKAQDVVDKLGSHAETKTHSRHIHKDDAKAYGLIVKDLESDDKLQDAVLSLHHACMLTFEKTGAVKIIENHDGTAYIKTVETILKPPV